MGVHLRSEEMAVKTTESVMRMSPSCRRREQIHVRREDATRKKDVRGRRSRMKTTTTIEAGRSGMSRRDFNFQMVRESAFIVGLTPFISNLMNTTPADASTSNQFVIEDDAGAALKNTEIISLPAIKKERFAPATVELSVPSPLWETSRAPIKQNKTLLYTDTYGPNNKYTFRLPRFSNSVDSRSCLEDATVSVQTAPSNEESIRDVGNINDIDVVSVPICALLVS